MHCEGFAVAYQQLPCAVADTQWVSHATALTASEVASRPCVAAMQLWQQLVSAAREPACCVLACCRNKGVVKDMRWTGAGDKICIAYDDGAVIVGSVDGNRLWGKDLNLQLSMLQWSPDGSYILFASAQGECHTYDSSGNAVARVQLFCNEGYNGEYSCSALHVSLMSVVVCLVLQQSLRKPSQQVH